MMKLAWSKKVGPAFRDKVFAICDGFRWNRETHASWLMSCMAFESGETFSPSVRNAAWQLVASTWVLAPTTSAWALRRWVRNIFVLTVSQEARHPKPSIFV